MKRIAWVTDIHLDLLDRSGIERFLDEIVRARPDALLVGGDIGEAGSVFAYLRQLAAVVGRPVYFVFGNHDYYEGSIAEVRDSARRVVQEVQNLFWLESSGVVRLTRSTALMGHGAWGDGRLGNYDRSPVMLNDFHKISELQGLDRRRRLMELKRLGDEAAEYLNRVGSEALLHFTELIVLTHVPPFKEACLYHGKIGDPDWLPFFTCDAVGRVLLELMERHPDRQMLVLCGHSHHAASVKILPNLSIRAGTALYGSPAIQSVFEVE